MLLNVENGRFLLALSCCVPSVGVYVAGVVGVVIAGVVVVVIGVVVGVVVVVKGNLCYFTFANQQNQ